MTSTDMGYNRDSAISNTILGSLNKRIFPFFPQNSVSFLNRVRGGLKKSCLEEECKEVVAKYRQESFS